MPAGQTGLMPPQVHHQLQRAWAWGERRNAMTGRPPPGRTGQFRGAEVGSISTLREHRRQTAAPWPAKRHSHSRLQTRRWHHITNTVGAAQSDPQLTGSPPGRGSSRGAPGWLAGCPWRSALPRTLPANGCSQHRSPDAGLLQRALAMLVGGTLETLCTGACCSVLAARMRMLLHAHR